MNTLCICSKNEIYKIFQRKKYWIILTVTLGITVCGALIGLISNSIISFSSQNYPYVILSLCCYVFVPFTALMLSSDLISSECERNELRFLLTKHASRTELLFGKLAAVIVYEFFLTAANVIAALIFSLIFSGFISKYICRSDVSRHYSNSNSSFCFFCRYYICILQKRNICLWDGSCSLWRIYASGACFFKNQQLDFYKLSYTV